MPEESTLRKYACAKLKLSRKRWDVNSSWLSLVNYVKVTNYRKTFQNKTFPELNSKKHTPSPTVWVLRNCRIAQNLSFAKAEKGNFARNDFCERLRKFLFFFAQNWCAKKEKFCVSFRKNCAKGDPIGLSTYSTLLIYMKINP